VCIRSLIVREGTKPQMFVWHRTIARMSAIGNLNLYPHHPWEMAGQPQQEQGQYDRSRMDADWWAPERPPSSQDGFNAPIFEPRVSQEPMNLARDDPRDDMTLDTASQSRATTDSVWSFESMRDIHEFIREYNGRRYNAQSSTYFLPAGQSSSPFFLFFLFLWPNGSPLLPCLDEVEYGRLCVPVSSLLSVMTSLVQ
jgi:hypothetical protein